MEHEAGDKGTSRAKALAEVCKPRCFLEVQFFLLQLCWRTVAERIDAAENDADIGVLGEKVLDGCIMPRRNNIIVVEKMDKVSAPGWPAQISYGAGEATCRFGVGHIYYSLVVQACDH